MAICPRLRATGACDTSGCEHRHNVKVCVPCGVVCDPIGNYKAHARGRAHKKMTNVDRRIFICSVCDKNCPESQWDRHVSSFEHTNTAEERGISPDVQPQEEPLPSHLRLCVVCDRILQKVQWNHHIAGRYHSRLKAFVTFRAAFEDAEKNKNNIQVSHSEDGVDFDVIGIDDSTQGVQMHVIIKSLAPQSKIEVKGVKLASSTRSPSPFTAVVQGKSMALVYDREFHIVVGFRHPNHGRYEDRLEILFRDISSRQDFMIARSLRVVVGSKTDHQELKPDTPYTPRKRATRDPEQHVVPGVRLKVTNGVAWVKKLPGAEIPRPVTKALQSDEPSSKIAPQFRVVRLPPALTSRSYAKHFQELLWAEEFQMQHDLGLYDLPDASLDKRGNLYLIPGLAENRPSVLIGDRILVQRHDSQKGHWFEGHVHVLEQFSAGLAFHGSFRGHTPQTRYRARFKLNRIPLRRQHQALLAEYQADPDRILFPTTSKKHLGQAPPTNDVRRAVYNPLIANNPAQLQAVASITRLPPGAAPFIIFGPPGTGKTVTTVESILQILRAQPRSCVVACAPSNSAADLITSRLRSLGSSALFRLYAPSRRKEQVDPSLLQFAHFSSATNQFAVPAVDTLKKYRVIVSTCVSASVLHGVGIKPGHFTHVFIDEAGQATEPEVMVSVKMLADDRTNIILSGDPKQLGPIIRSGVARELGFQQSFLERLICLPMYDERDGAGKTVVKLIQNFRSHPDILSFPNAQFYLNELEPHGDKKKTHSYTDWPHLKNRKFPILFHSVVGEDQRESSSPSFFNILETTLVKEYVEKLKQDKRFHITDDEIGIIAPYHAQCKKLRQALKKTAEGIKVGSVEEFQGQERRVIIISTVRSSTDFIEYDLRHTLGFVANPRRFNVAVTRAQALLIIVGDPKVLSLDPLWRKFLNFVWNKGGWKGDGPTWDPDEPVREEGGYDKEIVDDAVNDMDAFAQKLATMTLADIIPDIGDEDDRNEDTPWIVETE